MILPPDLLVSLKEWASEHEAIAALWLFGSRASGRHRADSDYDFAIELMPKRGKDDWAFTAYFFSHLQWKAELRALVAADVSLVCYRVDIPVRFDPRVERLWSRREDGAEIIHTSSGSELPTWRGFGPRRH
jgi:predicted nucleotidyltransferase